MSDYEMLSTQELQISEGKSRSEQVRSVFEDTPKYLSQRGVDVRFRVSTIADFAQRVAWTNLLDIGCGDGTISLPLLDASKKLTLLDLSSGMVQAARKNIPSEFSENVDVSQDNFADTLFQSQSFDLIISVGVLAHVDSPEEFIQKIRGLLRPGGSLIMEFTDSRHPVGWLARLWGRTKEIAAPPLYATNLFGAEEVYSLWARHGLKVERAFRYARIPLPGVHRLLGSVLEFKLAQLIFGDSISSRLGRFGNEYICLLNAE